MKLLFAIVDCYRTTLQEKLRERIDNLTETLAQVNKGFSERKGIYSELQSAEKELSKSRKIISSAVPREITNFITSLSNVIPDSAQWTNKFEEMAKCKVDDTKSSCISLPEWISILSKAHTVLTDNDWNHISVHVVCSFFSIDIGLLLVKKCKISNVLSSLLVSQTASRTCSWSVVFGGIRVPRSCCDDVWTLWSMATDC